MDAKDERRREVARQVIKLKRSARFHAALVTAADGSRPVVIALPDDTVERVFRIVDAAGGTATVVAPGMERGTWDLIPVTSDDDQRVAEDDCPLHPDTHIDMLVTYLRRLDRPVTCKVVAPDHGFGVVREFADA